MGINYLKGDATQPQSEGTQIIAHVCNDIGGWGRGFVLALSNRWPEPEKSYREWHASGQNFDLGEIQLVQVGSAIWVANMIGQHGIHASQGNPPVRYEAIESALLKLSNKAKELSASVHMPRIGCGLAGGKWEEVEAILKRTLCKNQIETFVYDFE